MNINIGDLVFVRGKSFFPRLIRAFDGEFSHVAIAISNNRVLQAQGMMRSGIVPFDYKNCEIVDLRLTDEQRQMVLPIAIQLCGYRYDYLQVVGYGLQELFHFRVHNLFNNPNWWLCSELADIYLHQIGWLHEDDESVGDYTPNEFYRMVIRRLDVAESA